MDYPKTIFLRRNDTLKGDGNLIIEKLVNVKSNSIRRNDTLKGDGNIF